MDPATNPVTSQDLQRVAPKVIERLRAMAELPQYGTVAGQAVASLFWEELGLPIRGPVNDIDVFVNRSLPRHMRALPPLPEDFDPMKQPERKVKTSSLGTSAISDYSHYEHVKFLAIRNTTRILRTYAEGLVNYTLIDNLRTPHEKFGHEDDVSMELVEGFDLNMVSVGINLETGNVSASPGFMEFLSTHRIKVQTCNTPSHTMIRLASKISKGQIEGVSCDMRQEMDLLKTAIACQRADDPFARRAIDLFGPKYRKLHGHLEHMLPPLEHIPLMDDERKIPGTDDPPQTVHLYRLLVPDPVSPGSRWLLAGARDTLSFDVYNLLYVAHFPALYDIAHPERSNLDPDAAASRRKLMDELRIISSSSDLRSEENSNSGLEGLGRVCEILGMKVFQSPLEGLDEKDTFAFFFGTQASKSQAQADRAAAVFDSMASVHGSLLLSLEEGADTAMQFEASPQSAWKDLVIAHGAEVFNAWSRIVRHQSISKAKDNHKVLQGIVDAFDDMGEHGATMLTTMWSQGRVLDVFLMQLQDAIGPVKGLEFMGWLSKKIIPSWPDLSNANPEHAAALLHGWAISDHPCPTQAITTSSRAIAQEALTRLLAVNGNGIYGSTSPVLIEDGSILVHRLMDSLTLQDILAEDKSLVDRALEKDAFNQLMTRAAAHPDSQMDPEGFRHMKDYLQVQSEDRSEVQGSITIHKKPLDQSIFLRASALLDQWIMQSTVEMPAAPPPARGMRL